MVRTNLAARALLPKVQNWHPSMAKIAERDGTENWRRRAPSLGFASASNPGTSGPPAGATGRTARRPRGRPPPNPPLTSQHGAVRRAPPQRQRLSDDPIPPGHHNQMPPAVREMRIDAVVATPNATVVEGGARRRPAHHRRAMDGLDGWMARSPLLSRGAGHLCSAMHHPRVDPWNILIGWRPSQYRSIWFGELFLLGFICAPIIFFFPLCLCASMDKSYSFIFFPFLIKIYIGWIGTLPLIIHMRKENIHFSKTKQSSSRNQFCL